MFGYYLYAVSYLKFKPWPQDKEEIPIFLIPVGLILFGIIFIISILFIFKLIIFLYFLLFLGLLLISIIKKYAIISYFLSFKKDEKPIGYVIVIIIQIIFLLSSLILLFSIPWGGFLK